MNTQKVKTGQDVVAVGFPGHQTALLARRGKVTREEPQNPAPGTEDSYEGAITLGFASDASVGPGDSGGVATDAEGRVIGITGHNDAIGHQPVFIPIREAEVMGKYPEIFMQIQRAFRVDQNLKDHSDTEHEDENLKRLDQRFDIFLNHIVGILEPVKGEQSVMKAILDDRSVRDMFSQFLVNARNKKKYNSIFMAAFGSYGVTPLFEGVG